MFGVLLQYLKLRRELYLARVRGYETYEVNDTCWYPKIFEMVKSAGFEVTKKDHSFHWWIISTKRNKYEH